MEAARQGAKVQRTSTIDEQLEENTRENIAHIQFSWNFVQVS